MLLRRLACAVAILGLSLGLAMADEIKGSITRIDEKKVTVVTGKKGEKKTTEYDIAKDCKFAKTEKKTKLELQDGVKNEVFQNIPAKKGLPATLNVVEGKVTEIIVNVPKKKDAN
jgi:hypothetical protein